MLFSLKHENSKRIALFSAIVISMALFWVGFFKQDFVAVYENMQFQRINAISRFDKYGDTNALLDIVPLPDVAGSTLKDARKLGIYQVHPNSLLSPDPYSIEGKNKQALYGYVDDYAGGIIEGWAILPDINATGSDMWLILKSKSKLFRLKISRVSRPDVSNFYHAGSLYNSSGYEGFLNIYNIPTGKYAIGVLVENGEESGVFWTSREYNIPQLFCLPSRHVNTYPGDQFHKGIYDSRKSNNSDTRLQRLAFLRKPIKRDRSHYSYW